MPLLSGRTPARAVALWAFVFHALAALWIWWRWGAGVRGGVLFWMDFPLSLAYAGAAGRALLASSLILGGALWAAIGGALAWLVGRLARGAGSAASAAARGPGPSPGPPAA